MVRCCGCLQFLKEAPFFKGKEGGRKFQKLDFLDQEFVQFV